MKRDPVCVPPDMAPLQALQLMRSFGIGALPVVVDEHLVGIVTEHDFMNVAGLLLLEQLDGVERARDLANRPGLWSAVVMGVTGGGGAAGSSGLTSPASARRSSHRP